MIRTERNREIREAIKKANLRTYEVAEELGISDNTFYRWLRMKLSDETKKHIIEVIERLSGSVKAN